jgi:hypothetical protein
VRKYQVQTSSILLDRTVMGSVVATNAPVLFLDTTATNQLRRFYRAFTNP